MSTETPADIRRRQHEEAADTIVAILAERPQTHAKWHAVLDAGDDLEAHIMDTVLDWVLEELFDHEPADLDAAIREVQPTCGEIAKRLVRRTEAGEFRS